MKHPEIDERSVVDLYVAGKLSPEEVESFEEHYLDCPQCIRAIEDARRLQDGLRQMAAEDVVTRRTVLAAASQILRSRVGAMLTAAALLVGLLPAGLVWQRTVQLDADLEGARRELAEERRPRINTPILALEPTRTGEQPLQRISLHAEPEWIVLAVELGDTARPRYGARIEADDGTTLWESEGLEPSYRGTLSISLYSSLLPPGDYLLRLDSEDQELSFPLQVVRI